MPTPASPFKKGLNVSGVMRQRSQPVMTERRPVNETKRQIWQLLRQLHRWPSLCIISKRKERGHVVCLILRRRQRWLTMPSAEVITPQSVESNVITLPSVVCSGKRRRCPSIWREMSPRRRRRTRCPALTLGPAAHLSLCVHLHRSLCGAPVCPRGPHEYKVGCGQDGVGYMLACCPLPR